MTTIDFTVKNSVAYVTFDRAEKHNAFDDAMIGELTHCFTKVTKQDNIRAMVLQARGKSFSAGADIAWMQRMANFTREQNQQDAMNLALMLQLLNTIPKPTIARIQGAAFGGAVGLIACCDMAVASESSQFCLSEVRLGLVPATISPYVIAAMGERACRRYFQTAEIFSAPEAKSLGLVSEVVLPSELDEQINALLEKILGNGPQAVANTKALISEVCGQPIDTQLMTYTSQRIADIRVSPEGQQGLRAFLQKQPAPWLERHDD
ncbi:enoyl-CoA hydratase/isomerase family protein [Alteromonas sp. C1M14]|uniref:enoyl-CoA hydratase/isomerase family protein n=1 Tax=Alteromonas sp. C1M14 TaxID=2841567 RepID=UPI001C094CEA|nr:enoyl-CoA hydratase/isomerase family protein [Alteromonas sp. C1M14]MBU2976682.1 enoyl-CoA hydratase/isomerase family protein [Alteromonas sp. C1M14]